jgi:hypothetical protein
MPLKIIRACKCPIPVVSPSMSAGQLTVDPDCCLMVHGLKMKEHASTRPGLGHTLRGNNQEKRCALYVKFKKTTFREQIAFFVPT